VNQTVFMKQFAEGYMIRFNS